jgi:hypothetical protein
VLPLNSSVSFTVAEHDKKGHQRPLGNLKWSAYNLKNRQEFPISPGGVFSAELPGRYRITAQDGQLKRSASVVVPKGLSRDPSEPPLRSNTVSWRSAPGANDIQLPQPAISGPGWNDANIGIAFSAAHPAGMPHPVIGSTSQLGKRRSALMGTASIATAPGAQNYTISVPVVNLPGRGLPVNLTLTYNSQVWTAVTDQNNNAGFVFDHQHAWPAVGWSLGFGRLVQMGSEGATVEEPNGMLRLFSGSVSQYSIDYSGSFHTTDGSLIDGSYYIRDDGCLSSGQALYPDGRAITFGAADQNCSSGTGAVYPIQIADANGNYISISYVGNHGPAIERIVDTVGRQISFHYDGNGALVSITGPGLNGAERTLLRFTYKPLNVTPNFYYKFYPAAWPVKKITSLYFPGDSSGFWFDDDNSYSPYGMIRKISERHSMSLDSNAPANEQREPSAGQMTREREFTYPSDDLSGNEAAEVPTYTTMFESWAGMTTPRTVTSFSGYWPGTSTNQGTYPPLPDSLCSVVGNPPAGYAVVAEVQLPDGSYQHTLISKEPNDPSFNQPYCESVVAADHMTVLRKTITYREMGDYDSPRVAVREVHDERDRTTKIQYGNDGPGRGATNQ